MIGLEARTFRSTCVSVVDPPTVAKYLIAYFADTVFPAPDSPDTMILWSRCSLIKQKPLVIPRHINVTTDVQYITNTLTEILKES